MDDNETRAQSDTLVEAGAAFMRLEGLEHGSATGAARTTGGAELAPRARDANCERFDVIVIGGGQAGLAVGYHLARRGISFVILDASARVGDAWRKRWDSLRLFSPARFDSLPGMRFPAPGHSFPTKDEMAAYLEAYAAHFRLPVRNSTRVDRLSRRDGRYLVTAGDKRFEAEQIVVAMASYQVARTPAFASALDRGIVQLHSSAYRNPSQLRAGPVLLVGGGNSGAEIALDVARSHRTLMAGRDNGHVPFRIDGLWARLCLSWLVLRFVFHRVLTIRTPIGRRVRASVISKGGPLVRVKPAHLSAAGIERTPRVTAVRDGKPVLADGRVLDVANVIWCTGYDGGFSWIDLPVCDEHGEPRHHAGVVATQPGLYFVGLHFLYAMSSTMVHGVGRDAARVVETLAKRRGTLAPAATEATATT